MPVHRASATPPDRRFGVPRRARWIGAAAALLTAVTTTVVSWSGQAHAAGAYSPEPSYQTNGRVLGIDSAHGVTYLGGQFTSVRPAAAAAGTKTVVRNHVAAIDSSDGSLLKWNPNVNGTVWVVNVVGRTVYLGGSFTSVGGVHRENLAAVDRDTGNVRRWNPSPDGQVRAIKQGPNGNIFIGGRFHSVYGKRRYEAAEVTRAGKLVAWKPVIRQVTGFACPPRCPPKVWTIAFSPDGKKVYLGGHFGIVNGVSRNSVAAVPIDDGSKVLAWNPNVYAAANCPTCKVTETERVFRIIVYQSKAYMCGGFWKTEGGKVIAFNLLVTNLTTGAKDPTFAAGNDGDTPSCAIRDGVFYFGGHFNWVGAICSQNPPSGQHTQKCTSANSTRRNHIAAVDAKTGKLLSWNPGANSKTGVWMLKGSSGYLAAGGDFTKIGSTAQEGIAIFTSAHLP
jgi:hypothetical protein